MNTRISGKWLRKYGFTHTNDFLNLLPFILLHAVNSLYYAKKGNR